MRHPDADTAGKGQTVAGMISISGRLALLALLALAGPARAEGPNDPPRIAALDLCADQVVMALVPPDRIAGLSPWAADPRVSAVADRARGMPRLSGSAESLLASGAGIAVASPFGHGKTLALARRLGLRVVFVPSADDFPGMLTALRAAADQLGYAAQGEALAASLQARLDRLAADRPAHPPSALYFRPDGGTAGRGTMVDAALAAAGYRNLATELGRPGWSHLDLETLTLHPPEIVVTSFFDAKSKSLRNTFAHHPLFRALLARARVIDVPGRLWSCGGWPLVEAAERLAAARPAETTP
jgi:iron complex transport system substrate-binding protein